MDLTVAIWTEHARQRARLRQIQESVVEATLRYPDSIRSVREGRVVVHGLTVVEADEYLLRIYVDIDREPPEIVTVYRTSKIQKYEAET